MTIPLTGAGSLGVRFGHWFGRSGDLLALRGSATAGPIVGTSASFPTGFATIQNTDYTSGTALPKLVAREPPFGILSAWQGSQGQYFNAVRQILQDTLGAMYNLDQATVLPEDAPYTLSTVVKYLVNQMTGSTISSPTSTVQQGTVSAGAQANVNTPTGNPQIVMSVKNVQGITLALLFPETLTFTCTADQQSGATAGNEKITVAGEASVDPFGAQGYLYPAGSGSSTTLTAVTGANSNDGNNLLQNSDFRTYTNANVADNWTNALGSTGTDIINGTAHPYLTGGGGIAFVGNAGGTGTLAQITQAFNTAPATGVGLGGTQYKLLADTQYAINFQMIVPAGVPAAGIITVSLQDGAGNILNDDFAVANSKTFNLNTLAVGNAFVNGNLVVRTPANLTTQTTPFKLSVKVTTAISTGSTLYIADLCMNKMTPLYAGGPFCSIFAGSTNLIAGLVPDQFTVAMANNYSTSGTGLFHQYFDRYFGLRALGLQLPTKSSSPTIADTLIA